MSNGPSSETPMTKYSSYPKPQAEYHQIIQNPDIFLLNLRSFHAFYATKFRFPLILFISCSFSVCLFCCVDFFCRALLLVRISEPGGRPEFLLMVTFDFFFLAFLFLFVFKFLACFAKGVLAILFLAPL